MKIAAKLVFLIGILAVGLFVGSAQAATVTIGNPLTGEVEEPGQCFNSEGCGTVLLELTDGRAEAPFDGTITQWKVAGATELPDYRLHVLRYEGEEEGEGGEGEPFFRVTATSAFEQPAAGSFVNTFSTNLPIQAGEFIALSVPSGGGIALFKGPSTEGFFSSSLEPGTVRSPQISQVPYELGFNATIEGASAPPPVVIPPAVTPGPVSNPPETHCVVPKVRGLKLRAAKRKLRKAHCKPGDLIIPAGPKGRSATNKLKVKRTKPKSGAVRPAGTRIKIVLARPHRH